jgi:hypothetical protein
LKSVFHSFMKRGRTTAIYRKKKDIIVASRMHPAERRPSFSLIHPHLAS